MELESQVETAYVTEDHHVAVRGDSARSPTETLCLQFLPYELLPVVREPAPPWGCAPSNLVRRHRPAGPGGEDHAAASK
ncbi:hypothetical protein [Streptomyces anulatus]|uniref:hypothetical protein n=1 Tax=Streptomyces anulatus TaxID=1892 RepID=UPI0036408A89